MWVKKSDKKIFDQTQTYFDLYLYESLNYMNIGNIYKQEHDYNKVEERALIRKSHDITFWGW